MSKTHKVRSLEDVARMFDEMAQEAGLAFMRAKTKREVAEMQARMSALHDAAAILRDTEIVQEGGE